MFLQTRKHGELELEVNSKPTVTCYQVPGLVLPRPGPVLTPQEGLDTYIDTFSTLGFVLIGFA